MCGGWLCIIKLRESSVAPCSEAEWRGAARSGAERSGAAQMTGGIQYQIAREQRSGSDDWWYTISNCERAA